MVEAEIAAQEKLEDGARNPEQLRQLGRALREVAAIPTRSESRPPAPGAKRDGMRLGGETRGGMAEPLLAAHRATIDSAPQSSPVAPTAAVPPVPVPEVAGDAPVAAGKPLLPQQAEMVRRIRELGERAGVDLDLTDGSRDAAQDAAPVSERPRRTHPDALNTAEGREMMHKRAAARKNGSAT